MNCSPWRTVKLATVTTKIGSGATPKGGEGSYKSEGIPLIRSQNVYNLDFSIEGLAFIDKEQARKLNNVEIKKDDILLNITGDSVARCTKVPKQYIGGRVNQHVAIIRVNKEKLNPDFLKYYLVSPYMQSLMLSMARSGGTRAALTKGMIESFEIPLPSLEEQNAISNILNNLDKKIQNNKQINKKLNDISQLLYEQWFVKFDFLDQFRNQYKSNNGKMIQSEVGLIPDGWKVALLDDLVSINTESIKPFENQTIVYEHYSIPALDKGNFPVFESGSNILSNKYKVEANSILISKLNPSTKRIWRPLSLTNKAICSTEFINFVPKESKYTDFCYSIIDSRKFTEFLVNHTTGSTNSRQRVKPKETLKFKVVIPNNEEIIISFCNIVKDIHEKQKNNILENHHLGNLRDTLLPKLMTGELQVVTQEIIEQKQI